MRGGLAAVGRGGLEPERSPTGASCCRPGAASAAPARTARGRRARWCCRSAERLAWISMVLVTRARRRGGLGTGLLRRCIEETRASAAGVAGLDATEQGRPIYLPLGFRDLYAISRWHFDRAWTTAIRPFRTGIEPAPDRAVGPARLLPSTIVRAAAWNGRRCWRICRRASLARAWIAEDAVGQDRRLRAGPRGQNGDLARARRRRQRGDCARADRARGRRGRRGPFIIDVPQAHARRAGLARSTGRGHAARLHAHDPGQDSQASTIPATSLPLPARNSG